MAWIVALERGLLDLEQIYSENRGIQWEIVVSRGV